MRLARMISTAMILVIFGPTMAQARACDPRYPPACLQIVDWYYHNTDMTGEEVHDFHIQCLENGGCTVY
jgi:hypothetical protein